MAFSFRHYLLRLTTIFFALSVVSIAYAQDVDVHADTSAPEYEEADDVFSSDAHLEAQQYADEQAAAEAHEAAIVKRYRKVGLGMRITGGVFLSVGGALAIAAIVLAVRPAETASDAFGDGLGAIALGVLSIVPLAVGSGLLAGGFGKRRRTIRRAKAEATYALSPTFYRGGGGASFMLQF